MRHDFDRTVEADDGPPLFKTFSVGVYEIIPTKDGRGTKRGKAKVRVSGLVEDPEKVYTNEDCTR